MEGLRRMQVYLTEKEIFALIDSATEWCDMMASGNEKSVELVNERLSDGLGSALYKLYKGRNGQRAYEEYRRK